MGKKIANALWGLGRWIAEKAGNLLLHLTLAGLFINLLVKVNPFATYKILWGAGIAVILLAIAFGKKVWSKVADTAIETSFTASHLLLVLWLVASMLPSWLGLKLDTKPILYILGCGLLVKAGVAYYRTCLFKQMFIEVIYSLIDWLMTSTTILVVCRLLFKAAVCPCLIIWAIAILLICLIIEYCFLDEEAKVVLGKVFTYLASVARRVLMFAILLWLLKVVTFSKVLIATAIYLVLLIATDEKARKKLKKLFE